MGAARIAILALALVCAIGLAFVVRGMMVAKRAPVAVAQAKLPPATPMTRVLVAKRDLAIGTRLAPSDIDWQSWPAQGLNPNFITDGSAPAPTPTTTAAKAAAGAAQVVQQLSGTPAMDSLIGAIVHQPILAGEPIQRTGQLVRGGDGGYLAVVLPPGMQALGVPVKSDSSAGGFILPGDRVDVIQSREVTPPGGQVAVRQTNPVVLNVRVLAIDQATKPADNTNTIIGAVATLEVSPEAADALVDAMAQGDLHLALRSYADIHAPSGVAKPRAADTTQTVRVFSQDATTEVAVSR